MVLIGRHNALLSLALLAFAFTVVSPVEGMHQRSMDKRVKRYFKPQTVRVDYAHGTADSLGDEPSFYFPILNDAGDTLAYLCYRSTAACSFGGCRDTSSCADGNAQFKEHIYYYALLNETDSILDLGILEYESTYGYEISSKWWLKQFLNKPTGNFDLHTNVDGISGATVSVKAMVDDLNRLNIPEP